MNQSRPTATPTARSAPTPLLSINVPGFELVQFDAHWIRSGAPVAPDRVGTRLGEVILAARELGWIWAEILDVTCSVHLIWVPFHQADTLDPESESYTGRLTGDAIGIHFEAEGI